MVLYALKVIVMFTAAITVLRFMGKSALAQVTPHDLVAMVMVSALAVQPILDTSFRKSLLGIALVISLHITFSKLTLYSWPKRLIIGKPTILVKHGKVIKENMRRCEVSMTELLSFIRSKGFPDIREVQYAILEPTGTLSILPRDDLYPLTPYDLNISVPHRGLAISLVIDGQIQTHNLQLIGKDVHWLKQELRKQGYNDIRQIMYASTVNGTTSIHVDDGKGSIDD